MKIYLFFFIFAGLKNILEKEETNGCMEMSHKPADSSLDMHTPPPPYS